MDGRIALGSLHGLAATMHDGGVIAAAEVTADLLEALAGDVSGEVNRDAAGRHQGPSPYGTP